MVGKIKRSLFAIFMNTTPGTAETATYALMGKGITSQKVDYNPETSTETYVSDDSATTDVESYAPILVHSKQPLSEIQYLTMWMICEMLALFWMPRKQM